MTYSFGDGDLAAERLRILDSAFAPAADAVLDLAPGTPRSVADLGCGPGATTARLVGRFPGARVTGLDASETFVALARVAVPGASFVTADVTRPLPGAPFDLLYARFLLAHLPDVTAAIAHWLASVRPDGVVILEETEFICSDDPVFARYEALSVARVARAGADVYAGPGIRASLADIGAAVLVDRVLDLEITAGQAAAMFWRNLASWGHDAVGQGLITEPDRAALLAALREREADDAPAPFAWGHHQTVLRRTLVRRRGTIVTVTAFESVSTWKPASVPSPMPARTSVVDAVADRVVALGPHRLRLVIDGRTGAGKSTFADELAAAIRARGRSTARASLDDFKHPWRHAREHGYDRESGEGYYRNPHDFTSARGLLLAPAGPDGDGHVVLCAHDPLTGVDHRDVVVTLPIDAVLVVDGVFAMRPEYDEFWDLRIWLDVDRATSRERGIGRDADREGHDEARKLHLTRYEVGEDLYVAEVEPLTRADVVIDHSDVGAPVIVRA